MSSLAQWKHQQEELENQSQNKSLAYIGLAVLFASLAICFVFYFRKSSHHKNVEELCVALKKEKQQLDKQYELVTNQMLQQDSKIQEQEVLLERREEQILFLQQRLDNLSPNSIEVLDKINRILADFKSKERSNLKMEDSDWRLLQFEMDKRLGGMITRIQQEYQLSDEDICICSLILADIPTSYQYCLFNWSRNNPYKRIQALFDKLGIKSNLGTYKKTLQTFIANMA